MREQETIATLVIAAADTPYSDYSQAKQADRQAEVAQLQFDLQQETTHAQQKQIIAQTAEDMLDQTRIEAASLRVSSGVAGVGRMITLSLFKDPMVQAGFENARTDKNRKNTFQQTEHDLQAGHINHDFAIAGAGVKTYNKHQDSKGKTENHKVMTEKIPE